MKKINLSFLLFVFFSFTCHANIAVQNILDVDFTVAKDGSGDFETIQEMIYALPDFRKNETRVFIKDGVYKEKLTLPSTKTNITFIGESKENTILTNDDYAGKLNAFGEEMGTTGSSSFFIFGENFRAENITFQNSSGEVGQAVAVRVDGDKAVFINCNFLGSQDTLYLHGRSSRQYYKGCYIEGTVDFIFGWSTAVFENCIIFAKRAGYITAASTEKESDYGMVFLNCKIEGSAPKHSVYLGRPWRNYAQTVWIYTEMADIIKPEAWNNWNKPDAETTTFYGEYGSTGEGAEGERVKWAKKIREADLEKFTFAAIFKDWNPNE